MPAQARWYDPRARSRASLDALEHLIGGFGTAILALIAAFWFLAVAVATLVGVGLLLAPSALRLVRVVADRERARLSRWGPEIIGPAPVPRRLRDAVRDPAIRRDLAWLLTHAVFGFLLGLVAITLPISVVQDVTFPLWWQLLPPDQREPTLVFWTVHDLPSALPVSALGVGWLVVAVGLGPVLARLQAWPGRRLLTPDAGTDLHLRIAELSATRAAALDAHAAELRRIERSLHDGTQNRLVAVTVLVGAARRALARDPAGATALLDRAQDAAEQALHELRAVARGILPPVLADRGLAGALAGLAGTCGVPCQVDVDLTGRCAASVEATVYFVVSEALTNVARHSGANRAAVTVRRDRDLLRVRVDDDGKGGADEHAGSGLGGIRRRIEAYDGALTLTSPPGGPTTLLVELPCGS
jgi:signal transduction histidine kinase